MQNEGVGHGSGQRTGQTRKPATQCLSWEEHFLGVAISLEAPESGGRGWRPSST